MHLCRVMCRILPICADLRRTVQWFAVIVPFHAVLCRAGRLPALRLRHLPRSPRRQPESKRPAAVLCRAEKAQPSCARAVMCQNRVCCRRLLALRLRRLPRFPRRLGGGTARRTRRFCRLCLGREPTACFCGSCDGMYVPPPTVCWSDKLRRNARYLSPCVLLLK